MREGNPSSCPPTPCPSPPGGGMAALVREKDWSKTPLGPAERWPHGLRVAVGICLGSRFPTFVWWGPELIQIYNDAYVPVLGERHPGALGRPAGAVWADAWPVVADDVGRVVGRGEPVSREQVRFVLERNGSPEERFFNYSYSPILDDTGGVGGLFGVCSDETARMLAERERDRLEAALRESEARYRAVFEASRDAKFIYTPDGTVVEANAAACAMYGTTRDEIVGVYAPDAIHPEARPLFREFQRVAGAGGDFHCETVDRRRDGSAFPIEVTGTSFRYNGRTHLMSVIRDLTERRRAEAAAREGAERLRAVFEQSTAGIAQLDLEGRFILVNQRFCDLIGYSREELLDLRMQDITHPDDVTPNLSLIEQAARDGRGYYLEKRYVRKDGSVLWVGVSGNILRDGGGSPQSALGVITDLTERKRADAALRAATERWELAVNATQDGIWDWDLAAGRVYWSPRCKEMLGYADHELRIDFDAVRDLIHPEDRERAWAETRRHIEGGTELFQSEYRLRHRDGSYRWVLARGRVIRGAGGEPVRMLGSQTDVTDAKAAREQLRVAKEEAERASRAKDEFIAVLSHELRTPLTPVLLTVSLMESHPGLPEDLRADVAAIRRNVELESRLISDLLDLTRISRGKLQLDEHDVDLHPIVRSAIDICQREASAKLAVDLRAARHTVRGDSTRLQQVFWNLINNAQKFTPPGGTIVVRSQDRPGGRVRVEVSDDGEGIDPAVLPKLFNAFEQGEARSRRQFAGLGLGLAICKKLVEAHGGTIAAASEGRGRGATFVVELPAVASPAPARGPRVTEVKAGAVRPLRVLLVEDNEPTLRVMTRLLERLGHRVTGTPTMAAGLAAARREPFDLLLSDLGLPDGSGLELMRELREQFAGRAVALTGYGMEEDVRRSHDAGFAAHLTKPIDLQTLQDTVRKVMKQREGSSR